jgi:GntR family transcriptional regulator
MKAKYLVFKELLEERISKLSHHSVIPSERDLSLEYSLSRMTVRKAIDELVRENKLYRVKNVGTFTVDTKLYKELETLTGFSSEVKKAGGHVENVLIEYALIKANDELAKLFNIEAGDHVYRIIRVRKKNKVPLIIDESYFPKYLIPLSEKIVEGSIYDYIQNELKLNISQAIQKIKATFCKDIYKSYLEVDDHTPIIYVEMTGFLDDMTVFEYSKSYKNSERYELVVKSHK